MTELAGKVAIVTGASRGLGAHLAKAYWQAGANVVLVARDHEALGQVRGSLMSAPIVPGQTASSIAQDIGETDAADRMVELATKTFGRVDILVCNAAVQGPIGRVWEVDWTNWVRTLNVDLVAQVALCRAVVPAMLRGGGGSIILLSGGGATGPRPGFSAYATAKAALVRFAETLAHEVAGTGISVNCLAPGALPTAMLAEVAAAGIERAGSREVENARHTLAHGETAVMARAAELAVFLASERSKGITGRLISAAWDDWESWPAHVQEIDESDLFTLRRIVGKDRGKGWGSK